MDSETKASSEPLSPELLDEVFLNNDGEEFTSDRNLVVGKKLQLSSNPRALPKVPPCVKGESARFGIDTEMPQQQLNTEMGAFGHFNGHIDTSFGAYPAPMSFHNQVGNAVGPTNWPVGQDVLYDPVMDIFSGTNNNMQNSSIQRPFINGGGGTGIRIRSRQPQHGLTPGSSYAAQGTAPRRIRLADFPIESVGNGSVKTNSREDEVQSAVTERSSIASAVVSDDQRISSSLNSPPSTVATDEGGCEGEKRLINRSDDDPRWRLGGVVEEIFIATTPFDTID
ncbi:hypothetical protein ACFE04_007329 [Oxalis oulophora]